MPTCGSYSIDIPAHDDIVILFINNVEVWRHDSWDVGSHTGVWKGYLDGNSTIEIRCSEGNGGALLAATFNLLSAPTATITSAPAVGGDLGDVIKLTAITSGFCHIISSAFDNTPGGTVTTGNASITGSECVLTTATTNQTSGYKITPSITPNAFEASYKQFIGGGTGADGMSFNYGDVTSSATGSGELGWYATALTVMYDTYPSSNIVVYYKGVQIGTAVSSFALQTNSYIPVNIAVNSEGKLTLTLNGTTIYSNLQLPAAYLSDNKAGWNFAFSARTAARTSNQKIDDLRISAQANLEYSINGTNWQTSTSFAGLAAGTYTVQARPACGTNSCVNTLGTATIASLLVAAPGNALNFDGTNDRVYAASPLPGVIANGAGNMTLEAWIKTSDTKLQEIINFSTEGSNRLMEFRINNNKLCIGTNGSNASSYFEITGATSINTGKWVHVAVVKTGVNYSMYVNGVLDGSGQINYNDPVTNIVNIGSAYWENNLQTGYTFNGNIDEVRIWNVARTFPQLQANMYNELNRSALPSGLSNYYRFSAASGTTLTDLSGNNRNGTLQNFSLSGTTSNWVESYAMVVPQSLTNTAINSFGFTANWTAPTVGEVDIYVLDVSTNSNFSTFLSGFNSKNIGNVTSYTVTGLTPTTTYYWRVRANKSSVTNQGAFISQSVITAKEPINVTSTTTVNNFDLLTNSAKVVDPNMAVVFSQNIPGFKISISSGKQDGDILSYTGTLPGGISAQSYDATTGVLTFTGTTSAANWQVLLRTVTFRAYKNGTGSRGISFSAGALNSFSNGHFYEYVAANNITWTAAKTAAAARTYLNYTGYLATVTSQGENDYIQQILTADAWMGASDDFSQINLATGTTTYGNQSTAEGKWYWVTGPEAGTQFMTSNGTANVVSGRYANWASNEPNNSSNTEHYGQFYSSNNAKWNDLPESYNIAGYLVEYGGLSSDIAQTPSYSVTMNVAAAEPANALNFDGTNDYGYASAIITNPTTFTLEAWFKTRNPTGGIVGLNNSISTVVNNYDRFIWLSGGKVNFGVYNGSTITLSSSATYNDGKYHHVAASFSTANGMKLYIDGVLIGSNGLNSVSAYDGYWRIGGFQTWGNGTNFLMDYFNGAIDEVKIWNTVRSIVEIQADLKNPAALGTSGLTHYFSFNQGIPAGTNTGLTNLYDQTTANRNAITSGLALTGATSNWVYSYAMVIATTTAATSKYSLGFTANWSAPTTGTATKYYLDVSANANFTSFVTEYDNRDVGNVFTLAINGLNANTTYYYRVRASNGTDNNGVASNVTSVITNVTETLVATAATNNSSISFTANWTAPAIHNITAYLLDVSTTSNFSAILPGYNGLSVSGLSQVVSGLIANTTYYYRVRVANYNNSNTIITNTNAPFAAIATNTSSVCLNGRQPTITFTGSGSTVLPYTFTYSINGVTQATLTTTASNTTVTVSVPTTTSGTKTYALISVADGSNGSNLQSGTALVAVNALPVPIITTTPAGAVCTTTDVEYSTQINQFNYAWSVAGVAGTDYTITTGSLATNSSSVNLRWLTPGSKTVSVNYTNSNGCTSPTPFNTVTTVAATPTVASITGATTTTAGLSTTLSNATANGVWNSSNNSIAAVSASGVVTAVGVGTATISYTVTSGSCSAAATTVYTVNAAPSPTITSFSPSSGIAGSAVTVTGTNYSGASTVTLNGQQVSFTVVSATSITLVVPTGTSGVIVITTPGGTATSSSFTITTQSAPTITSFTPVAASEGQTVTITGTNLLNASTLSFGATSVAGYTVVSSTSITAVIGSGTSGSASVITPGGTASLPGFTFLICAGDPVVSAGDPLTICASQSPFNITSSSTASEYSSLLWSTSGTGTFTNNTTVDALTNTVYSPSLSDLTNGSVTLTLSGIANAGCSNTTSTKTLSINPTSVGGTISGAATVCSGTNSTVLTLNGSRGSIQWQSSSDNNLFSNILNATGSTFTVSNITATTYYKAVVTSGVCSAASSNTATVTVNANSTIALSSAAGTNAQTACINNAITNITYTTTGATGATITGLPTGVAGSWASNVFTISGTPGVAGTFNYTVTISGGCTGGTNTALGSITIGINNWIGGTGNWNVAGNWSCGVVPNGTTDLTIATGTPNMNVDYTQSSGKTLSISGSGELIIAAGKTLTVNGTVNFAGKQVTIKSDVTGTGAIGKIAGTLNGASNVTVERYIPDNGFRSWRLLSVPTIGQTFQQSWQEGNAALQNNLPGYGTQITGAGTQAAAQAAGFDNNNISASPSLLSYNGSDFIGVADTRTAMATKEGYFLYVRGDRSQTTSNSGSTATTLRTNGSLYQGNQTTATIPAGSFGLVGNIYPSAIDFTQLSKSAGIDNTFYIWDSKIKYGNSLGVYQTFIGTNSWLPALPAGATGGSYTAGANTAIQSGQAFFVHASSNGTVTLTENSKTGSSGNLGFRPATPANTLVKIDSRLYGIGNNGSSLADANVVVFDNAYSNAVDANDALKMSNGGENMAIQRDGKTLTIEGRQVITSNDTIQYNLWNLQKQTYQLEFVPQNLGNTGLIALLEDAYLNSSKVIDLSATTAVNFTVNTNAASSAANRFRLVLKQTSVLPVSILSISANRSADGVQVNWKVAAEQGIRTYEILRSVDGSSFVTAGTVAAVGNSAAAISYNLLDAAAHSTSLFYKIKSIGLAGELKYSSIVKVGFGRQHAEITASPNPVQNGIIHLQLKDQPKGRYSVRLLTTTGQALYSKTINHTGGNNTELLYLPKAIARGNYQLEVTLPDNTQQVQTLLIHSN